MWGKNIANDFDRDWLTLLTCYFSKRAVLARLRQLKVGRVQLATSRQSSSSLVFFTLQLVSSSRYCFRIRKLQRSKKSLGEFCATSAPACLQTLASARSSGATRHAGRPVATRAAAQWKGILAAAAEWPLRQPFWGGLVRRRPMARAAHPQPHAAARGDGPSCG